MTIFTRGDRPADKPPEKSPTPSPKPSNEPTANAAPVAREIPRDKPGTAEQDAKRPQAAAQPVLPVNAPKPQPIHGTPMSNPTSPNSQSVSVISKALKITGQLESSEDIQIDGQVDGDVRAVHVKVGQNAKVKGTVYGEEVELAGTVEGRIEAKKVILSSTAHMSGDVSHQDIRIDSGAHIDGTLKPNFGKTTGKVSSASSAASSASTPASIAAARTAAE